MSDFSEMIHQRIDVMKNVYGLDFENMDLAQRTSEIIRHWNLLTLEYSELVEELPYKTINSKFENLLESNVKHEFIDMLNLVLNIGLLTGVFQNSDDIISAYTERYHSLMERSK